MGEAQQAEKKGEEAQPEAKGEEKKEELAEEEKKEEKMEEEKKEEVKPPEPVVLFVDMHCVGCAKKIERTILKVRGVEDVKINMVESQVTVKGMVDPEALCARIQRKTKRRASVISPIFPTSTESQDAAKPKMVNAQASEMSTVELNINMHCEACALQLQKKILRMRGVQTAETDLAGSKVTVTGTMDANKLVDYVYRRTRKQANIVPPPKAAEEEQKTEEKPTEEKREEEKVTVAEEKKGEEKKEEEKKEEDKKDTGGGEDQKKEEAEDGVKAEQMGEEDGKKVLAEDDALKKMVYHHPIYVIERVYAPQIFSDENPNACCIS